MKAVGLSVLGLSITVAGCSKESNQTQPVQSQSDAGASKAPESSAAARERGEALVRVVNAVPDAPPINVIAEKDTAFTGVEPKAVTPYKAIPASANDFKITPAAQESAQPLAENSEAIMSGRHYTLVAFPESTAARADKNDRNTDTNDKVSLDVIADDLVPPPAGKARIRVINAAPGTDDVEVYLKGQDDALFGDVDFKEALSYKQVDPMNTTLELRASSNALMDVNPKTGERSDATTPMSPAARADRPAADPGADRSAERRDANAPNVAGRVLGTHSVNLEAGKSYTIVLVGGKTGRQIETLVVEDMVPQTSAPTE